MRRHVLKRILTGILTILVVTILTFVLIRIAPGDPITLISGERTPSPAMREAFNAKYGLDKPIFEQLVIYFKSLLQGDFGTSIISKRPVLEIIGIYIGPTLMLTLTSAILSCLLGTSLGVITARRQGSVLDNFLSGMCYILYSMPGFWFGLMMILIFASRLGLFPTSGMISVRASYTGWAYIKDMLYHLALPCTTLTLVGMPAYYRIVKAALAQGMKDDYVTLFKATGMKVKKSFRKYSLRNAILPTVTSFGIHLAYVLGGSTALEIVFSWPGLGMMTFNAIKQRDYPLLMGAYIILSVSIAVSMILVDILYAVLDPRIRYD